MALGCRLGDERPPPLLTDSSIHTLRPTQFHYRFTFPSSPLLTSLPGISISTPLARRCFQRQRPEVILPRAFFSGSYLVGARGFEPPTPWSRKFQVVRDTAHRERRDRSIVNTPIGAS